MEGFAGVGVDDLLARLPASAGFGFEAELERTILFADVRGGGRDRALAFYRSALGRRELPWYVKLAVALEVEGGRHVELLPEVAALAEVRRGARGARRWELRLRGLPPAVTG